MTSDFEDAKEVCKREIRPDDGAVTSSWLLTAITHWNFEEERVLLLSEKALYCFDYDFDTRRILTSDRTEFDNLLRVQCGSVVWPDKIALHVLADGAARRGVRLHTSLEAPGFLTRWNPQAHMGFSTYVSYLDFRENVKGDAHKDVLGFQAALLEAIRPRATQGCEVAESTIRLDAWTGFAAKFQNEVLHNPVMEFKGTRLREAVRRGEVSLESTGSFPWSDVKLRKAGEEPTSEQFTAPAVAEAVTQEDSCV